ncbi:MAG TPA: NADP-dependent oxidoreductase [Bacillales bacterium]|nr:NADP-dependent oxidoreductase [Bacillales bacterium]
MENQRIILKSRPEAMPTEDHFNFEKAPLPEPDEGEVLVKTLYLSVDPYMRGRMNAGKSYIAPFEIGKAIAGGAIGEVVESKSPDFTKGDVVLGNLEWQLYNTIKGTHLKKVPDGVPLTAALGAVGMPGLTAYFGLLDIGNPKEGETVVVSGAAGAVGTVVGQIAKLKGCRVVGIAGSDEKIAYITDELGFDAGINYKTTTDMRQALKDACPNGVDIYYDNVGGEISDAVMRRINKYARIVVCGQIALYNLGKVDVGPRVGTLLIQNSALMKGFTIGDYQDRTSEGLADLSKWIAEGKITYRVNIVEGFENTLKAFFGLFHGENIGKQLVKVAEPSR